ncbi:hypothetical protein BKA57DRAFT_478444 [Linnemannia elongata]|nr:hypothetical protein BKA57DRAFT_478444 [Linnemannia elongata]
MKCRKDTKSRKRAPPCLSYVCIMFLCLQFFTIGLAMPIWLDVAQGRTERESKEKAKRNKALPGPYRPWFFYNSRPRSHTLRQRGGENDGEILVIPLGSSSSHSSIDQPLVGSSGFLQLRASGAISLLFCVHTIFLFPSVHF